MAKIHPSSVIDPKAQIADDVEIGPFCVVGPDVKIGAGTKLYSHVVLSGNTTIGKNNLIFPHACLGGWSQSLKDSVPDKNAAPLIIGDNNTFREFMTANAGASAEKPTTIGSNNLFLAYTHVAHECVVGSNIVMSNCATLAGHVHVGDRTIIGGLSAILQFTKIGRGAMIGGMAGVYHDVIPYGIVMGGGQRDGLAGLNLIGLQRAGIDKEKIFELQKAYKVLFDKTDGTFLERIAKIEGNADFMANPLVKEVVEFVKNPSKNNVLMPAE